MCRELWARDPCRLQTEFPGPWLTGPTRRGHNERATRGAMELGINYPWFHYGWDFGPAIPGWGERAAWRSRIAEDLDRLARAGVRVVRWFVLADGLSYGTGRSAPRRDQRGRHRMHEAPSLAPEVLDDFALLLSVVHRSGLQLLPCLLDFSIAFPGLDRHTLDPRVFRVWRSARDAAARLPEGYVKGGRGDLLRDPALGSAFLSAVLEPLLAASAEARDAIYAWEVCNEPDWIARATLTDWWRRPRHALALPPLVRFLDEATARIARHGFRSTIGYAHPSTPARWRDKQRAPEVSLQQVHFYPRAGEHLPRASEVADIPAVLGEFATRTLRPSAHDDAAASAWPELSSVEQDVAFRLARAAERGYVLALPWSLRARDRATCPESSALLRSIAAYAREPHAHAARS